MDAEEITALARQLLFAEAEAARDRAEHVGAALVTAVTGPLEQSGRVATVGVGNSGQLAVDRSRWSRL